MNEQLQILSKETWQREFVIDRNGDLGFSATTWDIEFALFAEGSTDLPLYTSTTGNGRAKWLQQAVARVTIPQAAISNFEPGEYAFYLRVIDTADTTEDPQGRSWMCLRGTLDVLESATATPTGMRSF